MSHLLVVPAPGKPIKSPLLNDRLEAYPCSETCMATLHQPNVLLSTSVTPTIVAPLSEPEYQPQQGNATTDDVHQDQEVLALDKPSPTPSPTLQGEADPNVVTWDGPDDPANPRNWSLRRKWLITILFSVTTFCAYVRIFSFPTQHSMYHLWQDVLVVITVLRCPVHRTRI
jgi:hypothetical protein